MGIRKRLWNWCPKPKKPDSPSLTRLTAPNHILFRIGGLLLPTIGAVLIAIYCYGGLLVLYDLEFAFSVGWLLFFAYVVGIALAIIGVTFRMRSVGLSPQPFRKTYLIAGLSLLTISIFGHIFDFLIGALNVTYPYALHSLLVRLFITARLGWLSPLLWSVGFVGWLLLFMGHTAWSKSLGSSNLLKWSHYVLALGAIFIFISVLFEVLPAFLPLGVSSLLCEPITIYFAFAYPLGVLGLTFGWATITSIHLSKHTFLFPTLYAAFLVTMAALFSIPV